MTKNNTIDIEKNWQRFKKELLDTKRQGVSDLIKYLEEETDIKIAPASTVHHLKKSGGLCHHSLNVLDYAKAVAELFPEKLFSETSVTITALIHDICKTNFYIQKEKWDGEYKEKTGEWRKILDWTIEDKFPIGHGEKSVILALKAGFKLLDDEIAAIRWHIGSFDSGTHFDYPSGFPYKKALKQYPLVGLLAIADQLAVLKENL